MRGAYYKIGTMSEEARAKDWWLHQPETMQGVALPLKLMQGYTVMPTVTPLIKVNHYKKLRRRGDSLRRCLHDDSCAYAEKLAGERGKYICASV